jgi:hypothetical protein
VVLDGDEAHVIFGAVDSQSFRHFGNLSTFL